MSILHPLDLDSPTAFECAQSGCRECQDALLRRHEGLIHAVLRRQARGGMAYEELLQVGRIGLWRALLGYDPGRGIAFSTYAWVAIQRKLWQAVKRASRPQGWQEPTETLDARAMAEERLWWGEIRRALFMAVHRLLGRQRQVIRAVCGWDGSPPRTFKQIGGAWGVSRQAATYWYYQALVSLRLPAVSGRLRHLWGADSRASYQRSQQRSRAWQRQRRGRRQP